MLGLLTANTYAYVNGNPLNAWDPTGHGICIKKLWGGECEDKKDHDDENFFGAFFSDLWSTTKTVYEASAFPMLYDPVGTVKDRFSTLKTLYTTNPIDTVQGIASATIDPFADALAADDYDGAAGHLLMGIVDILVTKKLDGILKVNNAAPHETPAAPKHAPSSKSAAPGHGSGPAGGRRAGANAPSLPTKTGSHPTNSHPAKGTNEPQATLRGQIHWVDEGGRLRDGASPGMRPDAYAYQSGTTGARSNASTGRGMAPQLRMAGRDGAVTTAKFDGVEGVNMIDRKLNVVWSNKMVDEARRQAGVAAYNGYGVVWELPTEGAADAAIRFLIQRARVDTIAVRTAAR